MTGLMSNLKSSRRSAPRLQRKNPSRMMADGLLAQQFSLNKISHRTGPVDLDFDYFSTAAERQSMINCVRSDEHHTANEDTPNRP
jgi:hypothetical protein